VEKAWHFLKIKKDFFKTVMEEKRMKEGIKKAGKSRKKQGKTLTSQAYIARILHRIIG